MKSREGSKIISCSSRIKRDSLERWKERKNTKEMCQKWKSLSNFGEVPGREREREREREERTPYMLWMEEIRRQLNEKVSQVNEFNVTFEKVKKEVAKKKGWTAPGIENIQNYWWKKLEPAQKALTRAFTKIKEDNKNIPTWWPTGRTVLLPKTKSQEDEKDYRTITCLNTSYKIMTRMVAKYMREHTMENEICDKSQLGAGEGILGMVDRCIMEEVKQYH